LGQHKGVLGLLKVINELRKRKFDLVIDYEQNHRLVTLISYFSGAKRRIGFYNATIKRGYLLTDKVMLKGSRHMIDNFDDLLVPLGIYAKTDRLERIWEPLESLDYCKKWLQERGVSEGDLLIGIHAGSGERVSSRRWSKEKFAELADRLIQKFAAKIIFTGSPDELALINDVVKLMKSSAIIAAGHTSVTQLVSLIGLLDMFISNDTGPMHISAAMEIQTIGLFGPETPQVYAPFGSRNISIYMKIKCSPCIIIHKGQSQNCKNPDCIELISVADVWQAAESLLKKNKKLNFRKYEFQKINS
jgi:heptosyltransferase-2